MAPAFSRRPNQTASVAASPEPAQEARAFSRWRSIAALKRVGVDRDAARLERVLGEIERKAVGVVERERGLALEPVAALERAGLLVEDGKPALERLAEAGFLELERLGDQRLGARAVRDRPGPSRAPASAPAATSAARARPAARRAAWRGA